MCVQTVGLIQAAIEREGIATVSISLMREITEQIVPPRALYVPYRFGYPLGAPRDVALQQRIIHEALALLSHIDDPLLMDFVP